MPSFKAGILDLDGVVVDSEALHLDATRIVFEQNALTLPEGGAGEFVGRTDLDIFSDAVARSGNPALDVAALLARKNEVYGSIKDQMEMVPGALRFIQRAVAGGVTLALATSSIRLNQTRAFEMFDLDPYFSTTVTADDVSRTKPDPEPYQLAAARLNMQPGHCFVIEDSFNGVRSARGAGCHVIGLTTSFTSEELASAGAHATFNSFDEITVYLKLAAPA